ncbi:MAG: mannose-6-phosphate isomerase, partial [Bacteroidales bacterium]|nr:mannose-6-phosphate isomerase [Bacteroidales bacterium]
DAEGNARELHVEEALEAINYEDNNNDLIAYRAQKNQTVDMVKSPYFVTRLMDFDKPVEKIYVSMDSFVLYICIDGAAEIRYNGSEKETVSVGETVLVPASIEEAVLVPIGSCRLLEVHMP